MKYLLFFCFIVSCSFSVSGQTKAQNFKSIQLQNPDLSGKELKSQLIHYNFSGLFTQTDNSVVYGFIGRDYQRIRIKLINVTKDKVANTYKIYGKSMVKDNICDFYGTITISNIRKFKVTSNGVDDVYKNAGIKGQFVIFGDYIFSENKNQKHAGTFKGVVASRFYIDRYNNIKYDDIDSVSDSFTNNQFVGEWTAYKGTLTERCNWGDFRIPDSGDLDIGTGEFSPNEKYLKNGWKNIGSIPPKAKW
ncbi:hypothetical protein [Mucilaginibacter sp.]|uniref:hypothetical protein n=1 Tax=Mucilaginibacter sp. TaxID=1882438 RepID=UPI0026268345|nr:hypothetical protein [Mucilaginibacter sp.]